MIFENYNIIRIGNITWGTNPNTFLNYIKNKMKNNKREPVIVHKEIDKVTTLEALLSLQNTSQNNLNSNNW